jgi:phosphoglycolate phosphatase
MKLVLFDCDGTLVDSAHVIHRCMQASFEDHGFVQPNLSETKSIIGLSLHDAIGILLKDQTTNQLDKMVQNYKDHFFKIRTQENLLEPLYAGIRDVLDQMKQRDELILGVVTGKSTRGLIAILEGHGLRDHFLPIRTADDCPSKPHPAMVTECCAEVGIDASSTYVIGDSTFDMDMANHANAKSVGVDWGYASVSELENSGANYIISNPSELIDIIG